MNRIQADQLLFTRVEAAYSPQRTAGFQTVCHSPALTADDVAAIEKRLQCFQADSPASIRYQYFQLDDGRAVLTHTLAIPSDLEITDKRGRGGAFLAHGLVLSPAAFAELQHNPFLVFDRFDFVEDAAEMVRRFGQAQRRAPPADIDMPADRSQSPPDCAQWSVEEVNKLRALALQAQALTRRGRSVLLVGDAEQIIDVLRLVFALLRGPMRTACTFDSCIDRCSVRPGEFWALGASRSSGLEEHLEIDCAAGRVLRGDVGGSGPASSGLYDQWLTQALARQDIPRIVQLAPAIQQIAGAVEAGEPFAPVASLDPAACDEFCEVFSALIAERLTRRIGSALTDRLGEFLAVYLRERLECRLQIQVAAETAEIPSSQLARWATAWIASASERQPVPQLRGADWAKLRALGRDGHAPQLRFWAAVLGRTVAVRDRDAALADMDAKDFEHAIAMLSRPIPPVQFVCQPHLRALLTGVSRQPCSDRELWRLVDAALAMPKRSATARLLAVLVPRATQIGPAWLPKFRRLLRNRAVAGSEFAKAVRQRETAVGATPPWWCRAWWQGLCRRIGLSKGD